jgi:hypothetical protein
MESSLKRELHTKVVIFILNLTLLFYLFRVAIPFLKYPFIVFYFMLILYSLLIFNKRIISTLKEYVKEYYLLLVLGLILVIQFFLSNKFYLNILKDILNAGILLSILFIITLIIVKKNDLGIFVNYLVKIIIVFAFIISVNNICNLFNLFENNYFIFYTGIRSHLYTEIEIDSNFAIIPSIFSMVAIFNYLLNAKSSRLSGLFHFLLTLYSLSIFFSGSRRGLLILGCFIILSAVIILGSKISRKILYKRIAPIAIHFLIPIIILGFSFWLFTSHTSYSFKNRTLEFIGSKNLIDSKTKIAEIIFKYIIPFNRSADFQDVYNSIWTPVFNPDDPESSWGTRIHKTVYPLTGPNVEIVPPHAKGYLMDSTCNPSYYTEIDVCESYSKIVKLNTSNGDHYRASVYCFVSEDFDGRVASFAFESKAIDQKIVEGNVYSYYDLSRRGTWQKLDLDFVCNGGEASIFLFFNKAGIRNFSTLKGHVIFAHPFYEKVNDPDNVLLLNPSDVSTGGVKRETVQYPKNTASFFQFDIKSLTNNASEFLNKGLFPFNQPLFINKDSINQDKDLIRSSISRLLPEDTTYFPYKNELVVSDFWNNHGGERIIRWYFALQIFSNEYAWHQKLIGGGFNFLNWFGFYFLKDKTKSDYPHNPLLSVLLYSGIFGLLIYCFFLYKVFYYYLKYVREYPLIFIFFLITFFFSFFSAGSPFDPPIMGFFVMLPFFIHYVEKKSSLNKENI